MPSPSIRISRVAWACILAALPACGPQPGAAVIESSNYPATESVSVSCEGDQVACGDSCVDLLNDPLSCGGCSASCSEAHVALPLCEEGECAGLCDWGWEDCNFDLRADGCETHLDEDPSNCGSCGNACAPGFACFDGRCEVPSKVLFVTSAEYSGNLGGLDGADAKCQEAAEMAGLPSGRTFKAWLSTRDQSAAGRLARSALPYLLRDGTRVADDWDSLSSAPLLNPILRDEYSSEVVGYPWTNTSPDGSALADDCAGWTSDSVDLKGVVGTTYRVDSLWSSFTRHYCSSTRRLICLEQ